MYKYPTLYRASASCVTLSTNDMNMSPRDGLTGTIPNNKKEKPQHSSHKHISMFPNPDTMPEVGSVVFIDVDVDTPFSKCIHTRFSKIGTCSPNGTAASDGTPVYQYNTWDPHTDQTLTVTQEDFIDDKSVHIRRIGVLYWG